MSGNHQEFVNTFLQLISLSSNVPNEQFYQTTDYSKLESLGPSLPTFKLDFPKTNAVEESSMSTLSFKSIKPPFKFTHQVSVPQSTTIYKVKTSLIDQVEVLKSTGVKEDNIKLLVKSKVAQDSTAISSLGADVAFSVMVSAPKLAPISVDEDPEVAEPVVISSSTWDKIYYVLKQDLKTDADAKEVLAKFQKAWAAV
jgi:hypothetical protein